MTKRKLRKARKAKERLAKKAQEFEAILKARKWVRDGQADRMDARA
jgi:hypothetical protein